MVDQVLRSHTLVEQPSSSSSSGSSEPPAPVGAALSTGGPKGKADPAPTAERKRPDAEVAKLSSGRLSPVRVRRQRTLMALACRWTPPKLPVS
jgi:hypothetical protein